MDVSVVGVVVAVKNGVGTTREDTSMVLGTLWGTRVLSITDLRGRGRGSRRVLSGPLSLRLGEGTSELWT